MFSGESSWGFLLESDGCWVRIDGQNFVDCCNTDLCNGSRGLRPAAGLAVQGLLLGALGVLLCVWLWWVGRCVGQACCWVCGSALVLVVGGRVGVRLGTSLGGWAG